MLIDIFLLLIITDLVYNFDVIMKLAMHIMAIMLGYSA